MISEVKDMDSQVLRALGKTPNKKTLKVNFELKFYNFSRKRTLKNVLG